MFDERVKTIALAIVRIFETGKPLGDYSACVVLNDGAGISYGTSQFTHRSGSLADVIERYIKIAGDAPELVVDALPDLRSGQHIAKRSDDNALKAALRRLGKLPEMQQAQREIAFERYLSPAIKACEGSKFVLPMSLCVIYDSMNHGSWAKIRDRVNTPDTNEKGWITEYVRKRDAWLESVDRLAVTDYRTDFFLAQIARGNWNMDLPMTVHGYRLTTDILFPSGTPTSSAAVASTPDEPVIPLAGVADAQADRSSEAQSPSSTETVIKEVVKTEGGAASIEQTNKSFNPDTITQYIPKMNGAKRIFGTLSFGGIVSTTLAAFNGLPPWAIFCLGMVTMAVVIGFVFIIVRYRANLFDLVKHVISVNADPTTNNIELTPEK